MRPDPLRDPRCLVTPDAVVIDGANGVCAEARLGARSLAPHAVAVHLALIAAVVVALLGRARWRAGAVVLCAGAALGAAAPGWRALFAQRADARAGAPVRALLDQLAAFSREHGGCVRVARNECVACEAMVHYAHPARARCRERASIELGADALGARCVRTAGGLRCGALSRAGSP